MGLRCSLLGHDFGDTVVEREREERGAEVVVTERELRECRRCDAESVVSENTEVRRLRPEETDDGADDEEAGDLVEEAEPATEPHDDAVIMENEEPPGELVPEAPDDGAGADPSSDATGVGDPHPEGPTTESAPDGTTTESAPDGTTAESAQDDADRATGDAGPATTGTDGRTESDGTVDGGAGQAESGPPDAATTTWPDVGQEETPGGAADGERDDSDFEFYERAAGEDRTGEAEPGTGSGIASRGPIESTGSLDDVEGVLVCPACQFEVPLARSSLRAGDICPECHAGYLAEER
ncbi:MAG: hypothetical protein ABEJ76_08030 [Halanaeroarchaeum sp.]